jgi:hypothetical protein
MMGSTRTQWWAGLVAIGTLAVAATIASGGAAPRLTVKGTETITVAEDFDSAVARCPAGKRLIAGGAPRNWRATGLNDSGSDVELTGLARCGKLEGVQVRTASATATAKVRVEATARCHQGERVAFGGFKLPQSLYDAAILDTLKLVRRGTAWKVGAFSFVNGGEMTAIAYCSKDAPRVRPAIEQVDAPANASVSATATCGDGRVVRFGGLRATVTSSDEYVLTTAFAPSGRRGWRVAATNGNDNDDGDLTAFAYCAKG